MYFCFSTDILLATPTEINYSRILFANFAMMILHRIMLQRLWSLDVWLALSQWSSVFCEFGDLPEFPWNAHLLHIGKRRPTYNRSWTCSKLPHSQEIIQLVDVFPKMLSTCSGWRGPSNLYLPYWVFESQSVGVFEISVLVSILSWVSPYCGSWVSPSSLQPIETRGMYHVFGLFRESNCNWAWELSVSTSSPDGMRAAHQPYHSARHDAIPAEWQSTGWIMCRIYHWSIALACSVGIKQVPQA